MRRAGFLTFIVLLKTSFPVSVICQPKTDSRLAFTLFFKKSSKFQKESRSELSAWQDFQIYFAYSSSAFPLFWLWHQIEC